MVRGNVKTPRINQLTNSPFTHDAKYIFVKLQDVADITEDGGCYIYICLEGMKCHKCRLEKNLTAM